MATGNGGIVVTGGLIEITIGKLVFEETRELADPDIAFGLYFNLSELTDEQKAELRACICKLEKSVNFVALGLSHKKQGPVDEPEPEDEDPTQ